MRRAALLAGTLGCVLLALGGCINISALPTGKTEEVVVRESPRWFETNKVAIVDVQDFIGIDNVLLPGTTVADVKEKLKRAADDSHVRAVVLRVSSPGGEVSASDTIFHEVMRFRKETGRPVVAAVVGMAASGGYYASLGADRIVIEPTAITGSVGATMTYVNVEGLFGKIGLKSEHIQSGALKDIASPTRPMTPEERKILQDLINTMFQRFLELVHERRPDMTQADLAAVSDGRILTSQQALDLHLVDRIGYLEDALDEAYKLAGITHAEVILYRHMPSYNENIYSATAGAPDPLARGLQMLLPPRAGATFLYLWTPEGN